MKALVWHVSLGDMSIAETHSYTKGRIDPVARDRLHLLPCGLENSVCEPLSTQGLQEDRGGNFIISWYFSNSFSWILKHYQEFLTSSMTEKHLSGSSVCHSTDQLGHLNDPKPNESLHPYVMIINRMRAQCSLLRSAFWHGWQQNLGFAHLNYLSSVMSG